MNRTIVAATLLALSSGAAYAQSENEQGLYLGAGIGQFDVNIEGVDSVDDQIRRLDDDDAAWQAFVGWRFNPYISLQLAYIDYGRPRDRFDASGSSGDFRAELAGFAPSIIGTLPLGPVELSAKAGYYFYDLDIRADIDDPLDPQFSSDESGEDFMYGVGVGATFFQHLNVKLEYEWIDLDNPRNLNIDDANALWVTGQWRF
ncbi:MAG: porin family protein [Pseudomonadota bacterium]|nr:porin family protein [Pseudomonadota bacterium]